MITDNTKREQIWESLNDSEYRHQFVEEEINVGLAFQIHSLRKKQHITQNNLATLLGVKQPLVSAWENPNYGKYTLATLKDLAKAFDVALSVRFIPFSKLVDLEVNLSSDAIAPPSFSEEEQSYNPESISPTTDIKKIDANNLPDFIKYNISDMYTAVDATIKKIKEPTYA